MANEFNFARKPFVNERGPRLVFGSCLFVVAALTLVHGYVLKRNLLREQEELDVKVQQLRDEIHKTDDVLARTKTDLARDQTSLGDERTDFLVRLYRRKSFSWTGLFNELESITPAPVRVTSIAPSEDKGEITVTLTVVGRTLQDVLEMVRVLESSSFFATVFPVDETNLAELQGRGTGIAATLKLQYVEASRRASGKAESAPSSTSADPAAALSDGYVASPAETPEPSEPSENTEPPENVEPKPGPAAPSGKTPTKKAEERR